MTVLCAPLSARGMDAVVERTTRAPGEQLAVPPAIVCQRLSAAAWPAWLADQPATHAQHRATWIITASGYSAAMSA